MILFYNKKTGDIVGTIDGRIHTEDHLKMWVGTKEENDRLIVQWKPIRDIKDKKGKVVAQDFEPDHKQKELFVEIEKQSQKLKDYKIDLKSKTLIKK